VTRPVASTDPKLACVDLLVECKDCGVTFPFTPGEQAFYRSKALSAPKRCAECRKWHREARQARESRGVEW